MVQSRNQQLLASLRQSIDDKPPYISGTLRLPHSFFSLFYKVAKDGHAARHINLANATPDELEQLTQACGPVFFGVDHEYDETDRKAGKMDSEFFSSTLDPFHTNLIKIIHGCLLEGKESTKHIKLEPYKLYIYGKGSLFQPHREVDAPRSKKMFGSLTIVFPTHHEGGALLLRHHGREWILDSSQALAGGRLDQPSIGYVAYLNNTEHEIAPVTSGHRVTLTYNLYFDDDGGPVSEKDAVSENFTPPKLPNQNGFREAFKALLENSEFMADGGTLVFGLRHIYPIKYNFKRVHNVLKGSDALVYQSVHALGFEPLLYMHYGGDEDIGPLEGAIMDNADLFNTLELFNEDSIHEIVQANGGIIMRQDDGRIHDNPYPHRNPDYSEMPELVEWVTPMTECNHQVDFFMVYGDKMMRLVDEDVCMIVRIGKAGDRLAYPTAAQVKKAYKWRRDEREYY